jgi:hypothetical protein
MFMSIMQTALQDVGYKPTIRPRDIRRAQERQDTTALLEKALDGMLAPLTIKEVPRSTAIEGSPAPANGKIVVVRGRERKIVVQRAGGFYRARYQGMVNSCFGTSPGAAASALKFFGDSPTTKSIKELMGDKYEQ